MQDAWLRIFLAATISAMGVVGTYVWSRSHRVNIAPKSSQPIARIASAINEVQRRPAERLIWQQTLGAEELHSGEAVRTGGTGTARIEFIGKDAYADLEPDTVIEIQETASGLNLDFLVGNLVVRSNSTTDQNITVQSGQQKVEVKNAEVAVAKAAPSAALDVDVLKGNAKVVKPKEDSLKPEPLKLKVLQPKREEIFYGDPELGAIVTFIWEKVKKPGYEVVIESGRERGQLKRDLSVAPVAAEKGQLQARLDNGKTYFRLLAIGPDQIPSMISSVELKPKIPPNLLEPAADGQVAVSEPGKTIDLAWANFGDLIDLNVEVAKRPDLKETVISQKMGSSLKHKLFLPEGKGTFFWRVSGKLPGTGIVVASQVQKFTVGQKELPPLAAPELFAPTDAKEISHVEIQQGVWLTWKPVLGADRYEMILVGAKTYRENATSPRINVSKLRPGIYRWSVIAKQGETRQSSESKPWVFTVADNPMFAWADGMVSTKQIFKTEKPTVKLAWQQGPGSPVKWRTRISRADRAMTESDWKYVDSPEYLTILDGAGLFKAEAESLDAAGKVIARAPARTMQMELAPPLRAPEFSPAGITRIKGRADGSADVRWHPITEAKQYILHVKSKEGEVLQSLTVESPNASIKGLKHGEYTVSLQTIDVLGRTGPEGPDRNLVIPEFSSVLPPKIKAVKVK